VVETVRTALVERDDALRRAREDLAGAHSVAATWEAEVSLPAPSSNGTTRPSRRLRG
jgi:hypothetical protein